MEAHLIVRLAHFFRENVDDHVAIVDKNPLLFAGTFSSQQHTGELLTHLGGDFTVDGALTEQFVDMLKPHSTTQHELFRPNLWA